MEHSGTCNKESDAHTLVNTGSAFLGALVGLAVGGPAGAVAGAVAPPLLSSLIERAVERRLARAHIVAQKALVTAGLSLTDALQILSSNDAKVDDFVRLLRDASNSDPILCDAFGAIAAQVLLSESDLQRERLVIIGDAIRYMRKAHVQILKLLDAAGGVLPAHELAEQLRIPQIELRSVVRDLELRGMIRDLETEPIQWKIRSLGTSIVRFSQTKIKDSHNALSQ